MKLKQRGHWRVVLRVAHWPESPEEGGAKSFPRDCRHSSVVECHLGKMDVVSSSLTGGFALRGKGVACGLAT